MSYQLYPSDLTDREWEYIKEMIPPPKPGGRDRKTDMRQVVNAIFYISRTGGAWRYLPREYPPWQTVYGYFRRWRIDGAWEHIHHRLRADVREKEGRSSQPSAAVLDCCWARNPHGIIGRNQVAIWRCTKPRCLACIPNARS